MSESKSGAALGCSPTRRQAVTGVTIVLGGLAAGSRAWGTARQSMAESQSTGAEAMRTHLHQEVDIKASPRRIYDVLLDSRQFAGFSGEAAQIDRDAGGAFSMFGGKIVGRNVELVPGQRIVQAWRPASWDPGVYSIVKFELEEQGSHTRVVLDHAGFPEGSFRTLDSGWHTRYWEPLKKFLT
jgi:activator of HSP90 ATPase